MKNIDPEVLKKVIEANNDLLDKLRNDPRVIDLGVKMQRAAFNLDAAGIKAGKDDYWSDMAVIAGYCMIAQVAEEKAGKAEWNKPKAANDDDMKMAA